MSSSSGSRERKIGRSPFLRAASRRSCSASTGRLRAQLLQRRVQPRRRIEGIELLARARAGSPSARRDSRRRRPWPCSCASAGWPDRARRRARAGAALRRGRRAGSQPAPSRAAAAGRRGSSSTAAANALSAAAVSNARKLAKPSTTSGALCVRSQAPCARRRWRSRSAHRLAPARARRAASTRCALSGSIASASRTTRSRRGELVGALLDVRQGEPRDDRRSARRRALRASGSRAASRSARASASRALQRQRRRVAAVRCASAFAMSASAPSMPRRRQARGGSARVEVGVRSARAAQRLLVGAGQRLDR